MHEIKCPKCGEVFTVDESGYAAIVGQVRDEEFHRELAQREKQLAAEKEKDLALVRTQAARSQEQSEAQLQRQIEEVFINASADLGNMHGRQRQFSLGFIGLVLYYIVMKQEISKRQDVQITEEEIEALVHQFMHGIYS